MPIVFNDLDADIYFDYTDKVPEKFVNLSTKKKESKPQLNLAILQFYALYRNTVYNSYSKKTEQENFASDIKSFAAPFKEPNQAKIIEAQYVYNYAVASSINAMQEWKDPDGKVKSYIAYEKLNNHSRKIGFVHFVEKTLNNSPIVYIAQAGVLEQGKGIGRRLMECVLSHYPAGTKFYIGTRNFNEEAISLYHKRLNFTPLDAKVIKELMGLDERYCGFTHQSNEEEVLAIKNKQANSKNKCKL